MIKQKLLLLGFAILGIGGFIYYKQASSTTNRITDFIPDNTLVLLETNEISTVKNSVIPRIPLLTNASSQYQILKSIGLSQKDIDLLIYKKTLYFALLPEGKDNLAFVNYLPLTSDNEDFIEKLNDLSQNNAGKRIIPHTTQGYKVLEVIDERAKSLFAYIIQNDFLIFSQSNLALEESILHTENRWINTLKLNKTASKSDTIFTKTHFNQVSLNSFLKSISVKNTVNFSSILPQSFEWLKPNINAIEAISTQNNFNLFEGQKSLSIQSLNMIPNSCSYSLIMSFSNKEKLVNQLEKNLENDKKINLLREKINGKFDVDFEKIYDKINDEVTLCSFDNSDQTLQNKVLIINQKGLLNPLKLISNKVASESKDDVFSVQYGSFLITSLGIKEFPMMLFGEIYAGFEECYFTEYNDYIIMSSNLTMMQDYLISINKGEVWSNSPKSKKILSHCLPANLTFIAENSKALRGLQKMLNIKWAEKINTYENALSGIQAEVLQISATDGRLVFLKNIEVNKTVQKTNYKWLKLGGINITSTSKPMYLLNPQTKNTQILVQSADNKLNLFENGKRIWNYQLNNKLVGDLKIIKYSKVVSQELIAVTKSKIFIFARNEKGFDVIESKPFKGLNLENFIVFENESDKEKNLTIISSEGSSFKLNKESLLLSSIGSPKNSGQTLVPMPSIIQNGSENVVILEKTGKLFLQNAKGKIASNFPINLSGNFVSPPLLEGDNNNIVIRMISEQGDLYKVSLEGKILEKRQLFRPNNEVKFAMAVDERNTDWVLMRTDGKEVIVLDKNEKELFVIKGLNYGKKVLYYYNLGIAGKYYSVNNGYENYLFFNENGDAIGQIPIESNYKPSLSYSDSYKKIIMNITKPGSLETWSVKIR
jgi:anti-sigma28 factor (negative regulator of flagellin synthesis)